jgi:hypothetical protein
VTSSETSSRVDELIGEASELVRKRDPMRAKATLERALALRPDDLNARNLLALCGLQLGRLEDALDLYVSIEAGAPDSVNAKVNLAFVLIKLGRAAAARPLLERAIELSPDYRRAWGYLGIALEQLGLYEDAERALLTGHYATAATRLRARHVDGEIKQPREFSPESARLAMPPGRYGRHTLPPNAPSPTGDAPATPTVGIAQLRRFNTTLRPPEFVAEGPVRITSPPLGLTSSGPPDHVDEIPSSTVFAPSRRSAPMDGDGAPKQTRPVVPLLDAALASLLVAPSEASVGVHPTGLVIVSLVESDAPEGGFAARLDCVQAAVGSLRPAPVPRQDPRRDPFAAQPFAEASHAPFGRFNGSGQLVLRPQPGARLLPLLMDADVAFIREELVAAFDHALLFDLGRIRLSKSHPLSLVRFRGDGVIVLELAHPFLAFDVRGEHAVTIRADTLVGWVGLLAPELQDGWYSAAPATDFVTFSGEGTVLFTCPAEP